jgi:hypothetical protein
VTKLSKICVLALQNRVYGTEIITWLDCMKIESINQK